MNFINSEFVFSLYPNLLTVDRPSSDIDVNQLIEIIKFGYIREIIEQLRVTGSEYRYKKIKKESIPCVTLSGTFNYRDYEGLVRHSGLMQIDIDHVDNYDTVFNRICDNSYTYVCFRSPGGKGLKVIVKIFPSADTHVGQFLALENYYKFQFGVTIDPRVKNVARAMLLSFDPDIYCNPWANQFKEVYRQEPYTRKKSRISEIQGKNQEDYLDESIDVVERLITELEKRHIDITYSYENWIKVGFALCTTFGESGRGYYHRLSRMYPNYTFKETEKIYTQLLSKNNGRTKLGTIIFLAKEAGIEIKNRF